MANCTGHIFQNKASKKIIFVIHRTKKLYQSLAKNKSEKVNYKKLYKLGHQHIFVCDEFTSMYSYILHNLLSIKFITIHIPVSSFRE